MKLVLLTWCCGPESLAASVPKLLVRFLGGQALDVEILKVAPYCQCRTRGCQGNRNPFLSLLRDTIDAPVTTRSSDTERATEATKKLWNRRISKRSDRECGLISRPNGALGGGRLKNPRLCVQESTSSFRSVNKSMRMQRMNVPDSRSALSCAPGIEEVKSLLPPVEAPPTVRLSRLALRHECSTWRLARLAWTPETSAPHIRART